MSTPLTSFAFAATGAPQSTTLPVRLSRTINIKDDYGAKGDGTTDDTTAIQNALNAAFGTTGSPHGGGANVYLNVPVFFPAGNYKITSALTVRSVRGGWIFGAGRLVTRIFNATSNGSVFVTNGFEYSVVERMSLDPNGIGVGFDLDWDNTGSTALQSNTFRDMFFNGGNYGVRVGNTGFQGSENLFEDCFWASSLVAGLATANGNALQQSVVGGNFQSCAIGIWVSSGSIPIIHGVGFQLSTDTDIAVDNTVGDSMSIHGCRSESVNFLRLHNGASAHVGASTHLNSSTSGVFCFCEGGSNVYAGSATLANSYSLAGKITSNGYVKLSGTYLGNISALASFTGALSIEQTHIGGSIGRDIINQKITSAGTRTYGVEATALTDGSFLDDGGAQTFTVTIASPAVFTTANATNHGLIADTPLFFTTTGALPTGLTAGTVYYVIATGLTATTFRVSTSVGGAAVNTTGSQSGTHSAFVGRTYAVGDQVLKSNVAAAGSPGWICTTAGVATVATFKALAAVAA